VQNLYVSYQRINYSSFVLLNQRTLFKLMYLHTYTVLVIQYRVQKFCPLIYDYWTAVFPATSLCYDCEVNDRPCDLWCNWLPVTPNPFCVPFSYIHALIYLYHHSCIVNSLEQKVTKSVLTCFYQNYVLERRSYCEVCTWPPVMSDCCVI